MPKHGDEAMRAFAELTEFHLRWWDLPFRHRPPRYVEVTGRGIVMHMPPKIRFPASVVAMRFDRLDGEGTYHGLAVLPNDEIPGYVAAVRFSLNLAMYAEVVRA